MKRSLPVFIALLFFCSTGVIQAQVQVSTLAGSGNEAYVNGVGTLASFYNPVAVATDVAGNVYVADSENNVIRKVTSTGVVTTLAGSGTAAYADGTGTAASFNWPNGIAVDLSGNVYVGDTGNNLIRKITPAGVVTTLAGSVGGGYADGTGTAALFIWPFGLDVDASGNVYVADNQNYLIRKITPAGVVTTLAGSLLNGNTNGTGIAASFNNPSDVAVDASGNIYVADTGNNLIRKITSAGVVTTLAGSGDYNNLNGTGTAASFNTPFGVAVDALGNVYVADAANNLIRKITPAGVVTTPVGTGFYGNTNGVGTSASFNNPTGIAVDAFGNVYIADSYNNTIRKITGMLNITTAVIPQTSDLDAKLYPIPASNQLTLALTLQSEKYIKLELINIAGNKVSSIEGNYGYGYHELNLSVESLPEGMYVANIYSDNQVINLKIFVER